MLSSEGANHVLLYFKTIAQNSVNESEFKAFNLKMKFNLDSLGKNLLISSLWIFLEKNLKPLKGSGFLCAIFHRAI
jgi:hypothetical protein